MKAIRIERMHAPTSRSVDMRYPRKGTTGSIHNKPDACFNSTDFYVGFIGSKDFSCIVIVVVYEWFDADSNCLTEVSYLLVGYVNVVKFF